MNEIARYIVGPTVVLFIVFLAASPFAWAIHHIIALVKRLTGTTSTIILYCAEVGALYMSADWYGDQVQGAIDAGVYDGPVGFGAGITAGFVMFFAGMLAILNGIGLWRLFRRPSRAQMQK
ncbi:MULTISPECIES: hypothetical protein [Rhizobium]|uniref:Uncharacterized protein n=1 Tax=Rhizobium ruizarguesonis TaxID=2081791 RepID=A0AAE8QC14_9HYPH|nr:hypothetical protein [Rhizobium ruizarguesonis]TBD09790.1 hypothetical protein ELH23_32785 [Rhizobium ruizarguesonis]TBF18869.1 hypothetical protein ELG94_11345 [Rhizobium ruizarguesonis]